MSLTSFRILWQILSISQVEILNSCSAKNRSCLHSRSLTLFSVYFKLNCHIYMKYSRTKTVRMLVFINKSLHITGSAFVHTKFYYDDKCVLLCYKQLRLIKCWTIKVKTEHRSTWSNVGYFIWLIRAFSIPWGLFRAWFIALASALSWAVPNRFIPRKSNS